MYISVDNRFFHDAYYPALLPSKTPEKSTIAIALIIVQHGCNAAPSTIHLTSRKFNVILRTDTGYPRAEIYSAVAMRLIR